MSPNSDATMASGLPPASPRRRSRLALLLGEESLAAGCRRLHGEEGGMVTLLTVVVFLLFLVLANLVWNIGWTSTTKIEVQNSADATAYSSALWMARGLNAVTATNHLMGEMMAFIVVRSALGEDHEKRRDHKDIPRHHFKKALLGDAAHQKDRFKQASQFLKAAHKAAELSIPQLPIVAFPPLESEDSAEFRGEADDIEMGATISDGRYQLMKVLTAAYAVKAVGGALEKFPPLAAVGLALDGIALGVEVVCLVEWFTLLGMEAVYRSTEPIAIALELGMVSANNFQKRIADRAVPDLALAAGPQIAAKNGCVGVVYPQGDDLKYFLADDPFGKLGEPDDQDELMRQSQIVRATYPWVKYHRRQIVNVLNALQFSRSAYHFVFWTNDFTLLKCRDIYKDKQCYLPVLAGSDPTNKGSEAWTSDQGVLERRFAVVGFAHRKAPRYSAPTVLGRPIPQGMAAYAMALVYNANMTAAQSPDGIPQDPAAGFQPNWGWDTLNWDLPTDRSHAHELPKEPDPEINRQRETSTPLRPKINLNWQAKLVPASSYLDTAIDGTSGSGPHHEIMKRMRDIRPSLRKQFQNH